MAALFALSRRGEPPQELLESGKRRIRGTYGLEKDGGEGVDAASVLFETDSLAPIFPLDCRLIRPFTAYSVWPGEVTTLKSSPS
jgi:hypothetical protein